MTLAALASTNLASGWAETLSLEGVLEQALHYAYDVQLAEIDTQLSRVNVQRAKVDYVPRISLRMNAEYLRNLDPNANGGGPVFVGDSVIPGNASRFQNSVGLNVSHTLMNFGIRKRRLDGARLGVQEAEAKHKLAIRDLKLKVIDVYADLLTQTSHLKFKEQILPLYQATYQMKHQLWQSGVVSKLDLADAALVVAQTSDEIQALRDKRSKALEALSFYTHQQYDPAETDVRPLEAEPEAGELVLDETKLPEFQLAKLQVENKATQVAIQKRAALPTINFYSNYNLFGSDPNSPGQSFQNVRNRTMTIGVALNIPVTDPIRNIPEIKRAQLEQARAEVESQKRLAEIRQQVAQWRQTARNIREELVIKGEIVDQTSDKQGMVNRLTDQALMDKTQSLKQKTEVLEQQRRLNEAQIRQAVALLKMKLVLAG